MVKLLLASIWGWKGQAEVEVFAAESIINCWANAQQREIRQEVQGIMRIHRGKKLTDTHFQESNFSWISAKIENQSLSRENVWVKSRRTMKNSSPVPQRPAGECPSLPLHLYRKTLQTDGTTYNSTLYIVVTMRPSKQGLWLSKLYHITPEESYGSTTLWTTSLCGPGTGRPPPSRAGSAACTNSSSLLPPLCVPVCSP